MNRTARSDLGVGGMIAPSTAGMPSLTYATSYELRHVLFSETRPDMSLVMLAAMAVVMLALMLGVQAIYVVSAAVFAA